jgi:hypothetical protein
MMKILPLITNFLKYSTESIFAKITFKDYNPFQNHDFWTY